MSVVGLQDQDQDQDRLLDRMKIGRGIKGLDDKSSGMEILISEDFAKINPTDPLILAKQTSRRKHIINAV